MGEIVDLEAWREARSTPLERLERAADRLDRVMSARGRRRAPLWLSAGIAEVRSALRERRMAEAADRAEALLRRAEGGGQEPLFG